MVILLFRTEKALIHPALSQASKRLIAGHFTVIFTEFSRISGYRNISPVRDGARITLSLGKLY